MLPTETFKMRYLLTFSLTKAIQNAESFLKNCELFVLEMYITLLMDFVTVC